jgi:hypothetical protein
MAKTKVFTLTVQNQPGAVAGIAKTLWVTMKVFSALMLMVVMTTAPCSALAASPQDQYPSLDHKQLGALRHIIELANQPPGSWRFMEPDIHPSNNDFRYQLAYMSYALAVVQSQVTPAYRATYQQAFRKLIQKMLRRDVWDGWLLVIENHKFKAYLDPAQDWRDPVREKNIMYSGHVLQMIGLYETLYDDREFDAPGALVFELPGAQGFRHTYNHEALAKLIADQFVRSGYVGVNCEPDMVFFECNQHAILGLIQFDQVHGAGLSAVRQGFWQKAMELHYIDPETHRTMLCYRVKEKERVNLPLAASDGWTGIMLHGWKREFVEGVYPAQRDAELSSLVDTNPERWRARWGRPLVSQDFGFLAAYAAEVGDHATAQTLLDYADQHLAPQWVNGGYFYPRHDVVGEEYEGPPKMVPANMLGQHQVGPLAGNALLNFARLNPGHGIWNLYNRISVASFARSGEPEVVEVRYPEVQITQAYYDKAARRLAVALVPGTGYQGRISFGIRHLSAMGRYIVTVDAREKARLDRGRLRNPKPQAFDARWDAASNELKLAFTLANGRTVVVEER